MRTRSMRALLLALALLLAMTFVLPAPAAADSPIVHVVGWGDTLSTIAVRYGTTVNALKQANNLRSADFIWTGQRLIIPTTSTTVPPLKSSTYTVQSGDTLFAIATRYGTSVAEVMSANRLYNYWIYAGQVLRIPSAPGGPPEPPPPAQGAYYVVRAGDYLSLIAARFAISTYAIQIANRLPNASFIWTGERLFIPGVAASVQPPVVVSPLQPPLYPTLLPYPPSPVVVATAVPNPNASAWEAVLLANTSTAPCYLSVNVVGKTDWPVVVATTDGSFISEPKLTGSKPEKGPYIVEFANACTGTWRVIPLGLNIYADITLHGGHADVEFHPRS